MKTYVGSASFELFLDDVHCISEYLDFMQLSVVDLFECAFDLFDFLFDRLYIASGDLL